MSRAVMQQALEDICGAKLCEINSMSSRVEMVRLMDSAITALRKALAEPEQEPVAWVHLVMQAQAIVKSKPTYKRFIDGTPLSNDIAVWMADFAQAHAAPTPRKPLTNEEISAILDDTLEGGSFFDVALAVARAIERAHGITGETK